MNVPPAMSSEAGPGVLNSRIVGAIAVAPLTLLHTERGGLFPAARIGFEAVMGYAGHTVCRTEVALCETDLPV